MNQYLFIGGPADGQRKVISKGVATVRVLDNVPDDVDSSEVVEYQRMELYDCGLRHTVYSCCGNPIDMLLKGYCGGID